MFTLQHDAVTWRLLLPEVLHKPVQAKVLCKTNQTVNMVKVKHVRLVCRVLKAAMFLERSVSAELVMLRNHFKARTSLPAAPGFPICQADPSVTADGSACLT